MSKLKFEVAFNSPSGVYYAGQECSGKVLVELQEEMRIRAVKIRCQGTAEVNFTDATKASRNHSDSLVYFDQNEIVFGNVTNTSITGSDAAVLKAGQHAFPFRFTLPPNLPSSFESKVGHVRYFCKAYLLRPWKFDHTCKKAFSVVGVVDLNNEPSAFTPGNASAEKKYGLVEQLLGCVKGGLSVHLQTDRLAFVPGENIVLNAEVHNYSSVKVQSVEAFLVQNVILTAKSGSRFYSGTDKIGLITKEGLTRGQEQLWANEIINVPPLPPSRLGGCKLINVDYLLKFIVQVERQESVILTLPVTIGTVPLRPLVPPHPANLPRQPSAPPLAEYLAPPPSYAECAYMAEADIHDAEDDQHLMGNLTYRPMYPTYATLMEVAQPFSYPQPSTAAGYPEKS